MRFAWRECVGILLFLSTVSAMTQERMPWQFSTSERVALRLDPERIRARRAIDANEKDQGKGRSRFVIDGRETPELFLRTELMTFLLSDFGDQVHRAKNVDSYRSEILRLGWSPEVFWGDFETNSASYYAHDVVATDDTVDALIPICQSRAAALEAMAGKYPRFEEFLYRVVAPRQTLISNQIVPGEQLLWLDGGCR